MKALESDNKTGAATSGSAAHLIHRHIPSRGDRTLDIAARGIQLQEGLQHPKDCDVSPSFGTWLRPDSLDSSKALISNKTVEG